MLEIDFVNNTKTAIGNYKKIAFQLINNGLKILEFQNFNITLAVQFIEDQHALELNKKYRSKDYIPDVLSFPTHLSEKEVAAIGYWEIGDIVISLPEAQRKAIKYNHPLELEVAFLLVHGFLHLLGFDHEKNVVEEQAMFRWQDKILASANYKYILTEN